MYILDLSFIIKCVICFLAYIHQLYSIRPHCVLSELLCGLLFTHFHKSIINFYFFCPFSLVILYVFSPLALQFEILYQPQSLQDGLIDTYHHCLSQPWPIKFFLLILFSKIIDQVQQFLIDLLSYRLGY